LRHQIVDFVLCLAASKLKIATRRFRLFIREKYTEVFIFL
jgi:hypothetical protein